MENWRKYLIESMLSHAEARKIAQNVLQNVINKEPFFPFPEEMEGDEHDLEVFLIRQAAKWLPTVDQIRGRSIDLYGLKKADSAKDILITYLQWALKGKTFEKVNADKKASDEHYGIKRLKPKKIDPSEIPRMTPKPPTPEELAKYGAGTAVFMPTESLSEMSEDRIALATAWGIFSQNAAHAGYDTEDIYSSSEILRRVLDEVDIGDVPGVSKNNLFNFIVKIVKLI
jgi:hypothetical protein